MALDTTKKKRNLLNIVDRLVEKTEAKNEAILRKKQEVLLPSPRSVVSIKPYLLPPTPSSGPASPSISDQESISDVEEQVSDKAAIIDVEIEEIKKDPGVPKQPLRCDVCGLRVYKSYRFANRTSAPAHLKNFVTPENDRIRVCKRCFSSRERCRQNLALVLLRSKTREMIHLRTPLGVTHNRATKAMDYISRDLRNGFKRPYEDLLCDETMVDEDEMEVGDEGFLLKGDTSKNQDVMSKLFALEKENAKEGVVSPTPVPGKNAGIVTVVKHHNGKYNPTPNCFTIYGEVDNLKIKEDAATINAGEKNEISPAIMATENLKKLVDQNPSLPLTVNITTNSEINTINNKLTFLDHAYALPPPKGKVPSAPKAQAVAKIKPPVNKIVKATSSSSKQEPQKKTASPDGQTTTSERTCGIVCFLCNNLVTKSYSCYKKENAPEKIKHLFTPGVKIVKVCRRCMPYKKPKDEDANAETGKAKLKAVKGKLAKIKSLKLVKNAKSTGKANAAKMNEKKVAGVKSLPKDDKKRREDKSKVVPAKKQYTVVVQTKKSPTSKVTATKDIKLSNNTKTIQVMKFVIPPKEETRLEGGKLVSPKGTNAGSKVLSTSLKSTGQKNDKGVNAGAAEKSKNNSIEKENSAENKLKSAKVDFGTQSMKSMIGISKFKTKAADSASSNEKTVKENGPASLNSNQKVEDKAKDKEVVVKLGINVEAEKVTEKTESTTSGNEASAVKKVATSNVEKKSQTEKEDGEQKLKDITCEECDKMDVNQEESEGLLKEMENAKTESKSTEEKSKDEKGETITDSKNVTENLNTRETRSASKSPVRAREMKLTEVPSPRRGRSSGTPDKKREDDKQIVPSVRTRKRLASFSESEVEKKAENDTAVGGKRRAVVALLEKMSRKSAESTSAQTVATTKVKEESTDVEVPEEEEKGHSMTRRNQMPIKCPGCNEKVVKSYRCFTRTNAPNHIKQLFKQQENPVEMLRVCRKCVKRKGKP